MVYAEAIKQQNGRLDKTYEKLGEMETRSRIEIMGWCSENNLKCLDCLPVLTQAVERNEQIYPSYIGGHPIAHGYYLLALAVNETLTKLNW